MCRQRINSCRKVRTTALGFAWGTAHFHVHFALDTSDRWREKVRTPLFCAYAPFVHEAPGLFHQFLWAPTVFVCSATSPADNSIEQCTLNDSVIKHAHHVTADIEGPEPSQEEETAQICTGWNSYNISLQIKAKTQAEITFPGRQIIPTNRNEKKKKSEV